MKYNSKKLGKEFFNENDIVILKTSFNENDIAILKTSFDELTKTCHNLHLKSKKNPKQYDLYQKANELFEKLSNVMEFIESHKDIHENIRPQYIDILQKYCDELFTLEVKTAFETHRGWHNDDAWKGLHGFMRKLIGVLLSMSIVVPVIWHVVKKDERHSFLNTFFNLPKTNSSRVLNQCERSVHKFIAAVKIN